MTVSSDEIKGATLFEQQMPDGSIRRLYMRAAWDHRPTGGIHNAELAFSVVRGESGVEWMFGTTWELPSSREHMRNLKYGADGLGSITTHSPFALYEGQSPSGPCKLTGCIACYAGSSFLASGELFEKFIVDPTTVWSELDKRLHELEERVLAAREDAKSL